VNGRRGQEASHSAPLIPDRLIAIPGTGASRLRTSRRRGRLKVLPMSPE
jgi:hypothetical protein